MSRLLLASAALALASFVTADAGHKSLPEAKALAAKEKELLLLDFSTEW